MMQQAGCQRLENALSSLSCIQDVVQMSRRARNEQKQRGDEWEETLSALLAERAAVNLRGENDGGKRLAFGAEFSAVLAVRKDRKRRLMSLYQNQKRRTTTQQLSISRSAPQLEHSPQQGTTQAGSSACPSSTVTQAHVLGACPKAWDSNEEQRVQGLLSEVLSESDTHGVALVTRALRIGSSSTIPNSRHLNENSALGRVLAEVLGLPTSREDNCTALVEAAVLPRVLDSSFVQEQVENKKCTSSNKSAVSRSFSEVVRLLAAKRPFALLRGLVLPLLEMALHSTTYLGAFEISVLKEALSACKRADPASLTNLLRNLLLPGSDRQSLNPGTRALSPGVLAVLQYIVNEKPAMSDDMLSALLLLLQAYTKTLTATNGNTKEQFEGHHDGNMVSALVHSLLTKLRLNPNRHLPQLAAILDQDALPRRMNKMCRKLLQAQQRRATKSKFEMMLN